MTLILCLFTRVPRGSFIKLAVMRKNHVCSIIPRIPQQFFLRSPFLRVLSKYVRRHLQRKQNI